MTECPGATGAIAGPRPRASTGPACFDDMRELFLKGLLEAHQGRAHTPENLRRGVCPLKNLEDPWNISPFQPFEDDPLTRRDPLDSCSGVTECAVLNTQIMIQMNLPGPITPDAKINRLSGLTASQTVTLLTPLKASCVCRQLRARDKR